MNINATNVGIYLKSWSLTQTKRRDLYVPPAGIRIHAGSCPLFPVDLRPELEIWVSAHPRLAHLPVAALPEAFSSFTAVSCKNVL